MERKFIFFDIDGTLTSSNPGGVILDSTIETLNKLRENGHFVAIATGRAHWLAMEAAKETNIYNFVHDGGNGLTIDGQLLGIEPLDHQKALKLIDEALKNDFHLEVVVDDSPLRYSNTEKVMEDPKAKVIVDPNLDFHSLKEIYRIFIDITLEEEKQLPTLKELGHMHYPGCGLIVEPDDKYKGIEKMVELLHGDLNDIVVFGDGENDYTMFQHAPISIAMGNAIDSLKEIATFITKSNKEDGIEYACRHFGWID